MRVISATAAHITVKGLGPSVSVFDANTDAKIGQCDLIRGFAHYYGVKGSAHEGMRAVVRGGVQGLTDALWRGLAHGRDDRL